MNRRDALCVVTSLAIAVAAAPAFAQSWPERPIKFIMAAPAGSSLDVLGRTIADKLTARLGQPVSLHIAVHSGPVVAGSLGGGAGAGYDVTGDTVNTASRLLGEAAPGTAPVALGGQRDRSGGTGEGHQPAATPCCRSR